ncbi:hypothetical protein BU23DRAFT_479997, partial [Bimuria novae-zelandiae CBS 107.79]
IQTLGKITGFAQVARPYLLRYAGGKLMSYAGNVSDAIYNLIIRHASMATFLKHYLLRRITVNTQAIV